MKDLQLASTAMRLSRIAAMNRAFALAGALSAMSCTELSARWNDHLVFYGTVRESGTETTLTNFCAETSVEHSDAIAFSAPAGTRVEEEVLIEGRTEKYWGVQPERPDTFWCTNEPLPYLHPVRPWTCLREADEDPPATILAVEPRGEMGISGWSSGYALTLEIQHPGVLHVVFDENCLRELSGFDSDAGTPDPQGEVTIK
jgi:hypothetical protein